MPENLTVPFPVVGAKILLNDVVLEKRGIKRPPSRRKEKGDVIGAYSKESADALKLLAANSGVTWTALILLTYPDEWPRDGLIARKHLSRFLNNLRFRFPGCKYIWVREYQERHAPHYHIIVDIPVGHTMHKWRKTRQTWAKIDTEKDAWAQRAWQAAIGHEIELPQHELIVSWEPIRDTNGGAKYMAKYASKMSQKTLPEEITNAGRWWMPSHGVKVQVLGRIPMDDATLSVIMGGDEVSKTGSTYRTLYGAAERFLHAETTGGMGIAKKPTGKIRVTHRDGCGCRKCGGGTSGGRMMSEARAQIAAETYLDGAARMVAVAWVSTHPLQRCAERMHQWFRLHTLPWRDMREQPGSEPTEPGASED